VVSVTPAGQQRASSVAHTPARHPLSKSRHGSSYFYPGNIGAALGYVIASRSLQQICIVNTGGLDLDQDFPRAWFGYLMVDHMDIGWFILGSHICSGLRYKADGLHLRRE